MTNNENTSTENFIPASDRQFTETYVLTLCENDKGEKAVRHPDGTMRPISGDEFADIIARGTSLLIRKE